MIKKIFLFLIILHLQNISFEHIYCSDISFSVSSPNQNHEKIKITSVVIGDNDLLSKVAKIIQFDLEFTDQLEVELKKTKNNLSKKLEDKLCEQGISLSLCLKQNNNKINLMLKDLNAQSVILEKEFIIDPKNKVLSTHKISDELIKMLTGEESVALSSIAYCKLTTPKQKIICLADYACQKEKIIVPTKTINLAPSWHSKAPVLFYSQFTRTNNRLMSVNIEKKQHKVICSYDGLNMQPSFSPDGTKAALCLSGGRNSELYLYDYNLCKKYNKRVFVQLTKNGGNNSSPHLLSNGDIIFCSDFESGNPQIYYRNKAKNKISRLTSGHGYCAAPSFCLKNNSIVYTRPINGTFQIFSLNINNFKNIREKQLTFGLGDKHEPSYSPCGHFIAFSYDYTDKNKGKTAQIAALNCNSGNIKILTNGKHAKSYPRWCKQALY